MERGNGNGDNGQKCHKDYEMHFLFFYFSITNDFLQAFLEKYTHIYGIQWVIFTLIFIHIQLFFLKLV